MAQHKPKLFLLLPVLALFCVGWAGSWDALKATAGTITSVRAEFVQEKHLAILAAPLVSGGVFYYQAPGSLRWEYRRPVRSILMMHEGRIRRFVGGSAGFREETGGGMDAMQIVMDQITFWLKGRFDESPMFDAGLNPSGLITLTPKDDAFRAVIQRIDIQMATQPGIIETVVIYESQDAYTRMRFTNTVLNEKMDTAVFRDIP
jgi:outer membrane lipoprotein-sorting protein